MITIAGIIFYLFITYWLINRRIQKENTGMKPMHVAAAVAFKTILGCAYGYIFLKTYGGDDTWQMHLYSTEQQALLQNNPLKFFTEFLPDGVFGRYQNTSEDVYYYLHDLEAWMIAKPFAIINFITGSNYYINIVFFSAITFWGQYWLFRTIQRRFAPAFLPVYLCVFFVPPIVFWLSGMRAEGLLLVFLMLLIVHFSRMLERFTLLSLVFIMVAFAGLIILRSAFAVLITPGLAAWALVKKSGKRPLIAFTACYGICVAIFLGSGLFSTENSLTAFVAARQHAFLGLNGNTRFELRALSSDPVSFLKVMPQALNNTFLRPYPWEAKGALQLASASEMVLFLLLVGMFLWRRRTGWRQVISDPLILTLVFFGFGLYLLTGLTVPFPGAIVRYKIIGELFFFTVLAAMTDWNLNKKFHIK